MTLTLPDPAPPRRRWLPSALAIVVSLCVGAGVAWAAITVFTPPSDVVDGASATTVTVASGEIAASMTLNAAAEWSPTGTAVNAASGVVTSVDATAGDLVQPGAALYSVDLRPAIVAIGDVPSFRALRRGVTGPDVRQLQALLRTLGTYTGQMDGVFASSTEQAVRAWQRSNGVAVDGVVQPGDLVFVPVLPIRVAIDPTMIAPGVRLAGGEAAVLELPDSPGFALSITAAQAAAIPDGARVEIAGPDGATWITSAATRTTDDESSGVTIALASPDGAAICAQDCGTIPPVGKTLLAAKVVTVPSLSGLVVPTAALKTLADGSVVVIGESGDELEVQVIGSARGMSVIEGVDAGTKVRIPAGDG